MKSTLIAAAVALLPLAVHAGGDQNKAKPTAQPSTETPTGSGSSFDTLDANKDGRISMPEASADPSLVETFSAADKNGDGYLDAAEYDARPKPRS